MLGALPAVGHVLLAEHLVQAIVLQRERCHVTDGVDVRVAGLQLAVHLRAAIPCFRRALQYRTIYQPLQVLACSLNMSLLSCQIDKRMW